MYSYIHSYVSLCICICIMSMHSSLKHTYVCLGVCPTSVSKWGEGRYQAVLGVADSGGFCSVVLQLEGSRGKMEFPSRVCEVQPNT